MSPLDRIAQLSDENAPLRSQLLDAQEQAKRDSETIARLVKDRDDSISLLRTCSDDLHMAAHIIRTGGTQAGRRMALEADEKTTWPNVRAFLSRHA